MKDVIVTQGKKKKKGVDILSCKMYRHISILGLLLASILILFNYGCTASDEEVSKVREQYETEL